MSRYREWKLDSKVYIGNLSESAVKPDIESAFGKYGPLKNVWVARNPPGFAFVEFEDGRDAEDAPRFGWNENRRSPGPRGDVAWPYPSGRW